MRLDATSRFKLPRKYRVENLLESFKIKGLNAYALVVFVRINNYGINEVEIIMKKLYRAHLSTRNEKNSLIEKVRQNNNVAQMDFT